MNTSRNPQGTVTRAKKKAFSHDNGKTYFDKKTERSVFFILTVIMLILGILGKFGLF